MHLLANWSQMSFSLDDNLVSKDTGTTARETPTVVLSRGGWKQSPVYTDTAPRHTNSSGGLAVLQKCQKHALLSDDDILQVVQWLGKAHLMPVPARQLYHHGLFSCPFSARVLEVKHFQKHFHFDCFFYLELTIFFLEFFIFWLAIFS